MSEYKKLLVDRLGSLWSYTPDEYAKEAYGPFAEVVVIPGTLPEVTVREGGNDGWTQFRVGQTWLTGSHPPDDYERWALEYLAFAQHLRQQKPKVEEPTGLGAVVEYDAPDGTRARATLAILPASDTQPWFTVRERWGWLDWSDLKNPVVLSPGVETGS